jgi:hypothetical protein
MRLIRSTTLVIPALLLSLAACGSDKGAASEAPLSSAPATDAIGPAYRGAAGVVGAAAGDFEPAFDSSDYAGAAGVVGAVAGNVRSLQRSR